MSCIIEHLLGDLQMGARPLCSRGTALLVTFLTLVALAGVTAEVWCHACCNICTHATILSTTSFL